MKKDYTREELIMICEKGVVSMDKWANRDSCIAQAQLNDIYGLLKVNSEYSLDYDFFQGMVGIYFNSPTEEEIENCRKISLDINTYDEYREKYGDEEEMFEPSEYPIAHEGFHGYIPTQERLDEAGGRDWY